MVTKTRIAVAVTTLFLACMVPVTAARKAQIKAEPLGTSQLRVSVKAGKGMWLGVSLLSPDGKSARMDRVFPLSSGNFRKRIKVARKLRGGTYELALWRSLVQAVDCTKQGCQYCPIYGQHLESQVAYRSGRLKSGLVTGPAFRLQRTGGPWNGALLSVPLR